MNIAIDGYEANVKNRVGIGRYAFEILSHIYNLQPKHLFRIYIPSKPLPDMPKETSWWKYRIVRPKTLWTFFGLPGALTKDKPDVIFSPTHYVPRFVKIPRVMAIMDLSYLEYPELFRKQDLHKLKNWTAYGASIAKKILTISNFSKNDIIKTYKIDPEKVVVTYPGMSKQLISEAPAEKNYILSVGTIQPRKNYIRLIEAFSMVLPNFPGLKLVIIGKKGWLFDETLEAPSKFGILKDVIFLHSVQDTLLSGFYQHAKCLVLPSLYEGFGLPVLEAMALKCPVVVSRISSLPEIAGDAGIYVDPENVESIADGIIKALTEKNDDRIKKGLIQVKKFSWEKAARQTLEVLESI
ncbi:hypothetical protein A3A79_05095 [Candidatus Gottesmanbacteria bacterium RIFCSPLOWO2_01_FULL_43_11b]|uniref:Uncharacterized protein n=1 Tax=Candidatus Gottesmanbacteria bacterium RIFCSPLOWO2_01_FULL_43_11b TaxID=1798392 RepID=A0A1F6AIK6_9BACT|nr:MAG: hypothetical protein A3A79_05095 [Candidatus Gottesmanbacteria bacterium RIFCSPLOWO2_01_FULL_43_11b]